MGRDPFEASAVTRPCARGLIDLAERTINIYDPDGYLDGPPHEVFTELRRTQPVFFQEMPDEPGYWAVLKHADVDPRRRGAGAVLGQRGRRGAREPHARARSSRCA